ncbi:MAG: nuclear transport factor 2 family protein [Gammaproteobacteria bacterium]|nr:nuclear transport factor 2 family protein [Gammaproteobacteria bacterium]
MYRFFCTACVWLWLAVGASAAPPSSDPVAVVKAMNAAITARDLKAATALFAKGGVQFSVRPAHTGLGGAPAGVSTDLTGHWSTIGPVLFSATSGYKREVEIVDTRVAGDIATVWTRTKTRSERAGQPPRSDSFPEVYLLLKTGGEWKIGAIADDRRPNDIGLGGSAKP